MDIEKILYYVCDPESETEFWYGKMVGVYNEHEFCYDWSHVDEVPLHAKFIGAYK